jgi:hypothetical protein
MINTPIDFGEMIGAPLNAIIQGETIPLLLNASKSTVKVLPQPLPTKSATTQDTTTKVDLLMKLNIVQADIPSGLAKVFSAFEAAMGELKPVAKAVESVESVLLPVSKEAVE